MFCYYILIDFCIQNDRARGIWSAAREGDIDTISRLLPDATREDLCIEGVVSII